MMGSRGTCLISIVTSVIVTQCKRCQLNSFQSYQPYLYCSIFSAENCNMERRLVTNFINILHEVTYIEVFTVNYL